MADTAPQHSSCPAIPSHWRPIRSYVRRGASRMSRSKLLAYQRLASTHCIAIGSLADATQHFAHPQRPLIVEIGSGMGQATAQLARQRATINYLAFEVYRPGVARLLWFISRYALENVKIVERDCLPILMQSRRLLEGVHIHFPDPWPKRRHHKRRLISRSFFMTLIPLLRSGGYISIVTDNYHYAQSIMAHSRSLPLINPYDGFAPRQQWRFPTAFEIRAQQAGRPIYELLLRIPTTPSPSYY